MKLFPREALVRANPDNKLMHCFLVKYRVNPMGTVVNPTYYCSRGAQNRKQQCSSSPLRSSTSWSQCIFNVVYDSMKLNSYRVLHYATAPVGTRVNGCCRYHPLTNVICIIMVVSSRHILYFFFPINLKIRFVLKPQINHTHKGV